MMKKPFQRGGREKNVIHEAFDAPLPPNAREWFLPIGDETEELPYQGATRKCSGWRLPGNFRMDEYLRQNLVCGGHLLGWKERALLKLRQKVAAHELDGF
jgi:hypothetical protein